MKTQEEQMASLTTVYLISLVLASISAMGSTFLGSKFTAPKIVETVETPQNIEQTEALVSEEVSPPEEQ